MTQVKQARDQTKKELQLAEAAKVLLPDYAQGGELTVNPDSPNLPRIKVK